MYEIEPAELSLQRAGLEIRSDSAGTPSPLLGDVYLATAGPGGRVYLYDRDRQVIRMYDASGSYLDSLGREGAGPGEFRWVFSMLALPGGGLAAADRSNATISVFGASGELKQSTTALGLHTVSSMDRLPDGRFILAGWHPDNGRMIHIADSGLSGLQSSLLDYQSLLSTGVGGNPGLTSHRRSMGGRVKALGPDRLAFVPHFYGGRILLFEETGSGRWQADTLAGADRIENPLRMTPQQEESALEQFPPQSIISFTPGSGGSILHMLSRSVGLHVDGNSLVHLFLRYKGDTTFLVAERFDTQTRELTGYGRLDMGRNPILRPLALDRQGDLIMELADSAKVVRMTLSGDY